MNVKCYDGVSEFSLEFPCALLCCLRKDDNILNYENVVGKQAMFAVNHDAMRAFSNNHELATLMSDRCSREHTCSGQCDASLCRSESCHAATLLPAAQVHET